MNLSAQQDQALKKVSQWLNGDTKKNQVFRLFGYAGVGKTSIAQRLAQDVHGDVYFAAFTGKASLVLKQKGCPRTSTIHSLIYSPTGNDASGYEDARKAVEQYTKHLRDDKKLSPEEIATHPRLLELKLLMSNEHMRAKRPRFKLNTDSVLNGAALLVVDEVSMVDVPTGEDLESFGCPILVLGDPAQLPPVKGTGYFTMANPDFMLTEIHRQARDNPIIRLATLARERKQIPLGKYGTSEVITKADLRPRPELVTGRSQVICGTHKTRIPGNLRCRELLGRTDILPVPGDKLVCLRNNKEMGVLNGGLWEVVEVHAVGDETATVTLTSLDLPETLYGIDIDIKYFQTKGQEELPFWMTDIGRFDYGYLLTCHKAQGSQWDDLTVIDESDAFRADKFAHLYTAITRAAKEIVLAVQ